jgi:acyl-coenzyme A thioesterase PaaI-like protein
MTPQQVLDLWRRLAPLPGGRWLFGRLIAFGIPYSASTGARVRLLEPGHCIVVLKDRRGVRNHLNSIHAVALTNVGELASGLAMTTALPAGTRAIVTKLATEYLKKARGTIVVESRVADPPRPAVPMEVQVEATMTDASGEVVARVQAIWLVAPAQERKTP